MYAAFRRRQLYQRSRLNLEMTPEGQVTGNSISEVADRISTYVIERAVSEMKRDGRPKSRAEQKDKNRQENV